MSEEIIEQQIQEKGLNAPRLTPEHINKKIVSEDYYVFPGTTLTICRLGLENGFSVTGESAAASLENFDEQIGRDIAKENARHKVWMLEGYLLKQRLFEDREMTYIDASNMSLKEVKELIAYYKEQR